MQAQPTIFLFNQMRMGNRDAACELLYKQTPWVLKQAERMMLPESQKRCDAEDIVQDLFLLLYPKVSEFRGSTLAEFRAWVKSSLKNKVREQIRRDHSQKRDVSRERTKSATASCLLANHPDRCRTPSRIVAQQEQLELLKQALSELPPRQASALELKLLKGLTEKEIADQLGEPSNAVKGLLKRGMDKLKQKLTIS